eukprot:scaffold243293_cov19-Tisochrysis_lutea.AAC.1
MKEHPGTVVGWSKNWKKSSTNLHATDNKAQTPSALYTQPVLDVLATLLVRIQSSLVSGKLSALIV